MLISLETHVRTCYFQGVGGVRTPYPPLDPQMGNVIIKRDNIYHSPAS